MEKFDIICRDCGGKAKVRDYPNDAHGGKVVQCEKCGNMERI